MSVYLTKTVEGLRTAFGLRAGGSRRSSATPPKGFTAISAFDERDVFIAGYPKSGNTWLQDLISAAVYGVNPRFCPAALVQELVPDVHYKEFYQRYSTPMFFKTHNLPRREYKRVVHLLRDGRDVMVSYFHHLAALQTDPLDFLELVNRPDLYPCRWHEHYNAWRANPYRASILTVKFEDMKQDTTRELARVCEFAGVERDRAYLDEIAQAAAFDKMQSKEARDPVHFDSRWSKDKLFRRRGEIGSYKDEMPPDVLQAFLAIANDTLRQSGYV